ncbi:Threonine transporter RhtB [Pseudomonas syringae pv. persicae]|uniref:Threonine transporter RhtB n=1 Tax=Pseudomonas syringae pv. persicae TaxID=237306 RepID=A0A3M4AEP9_9PSED|nr:Threonine transporter RhtB [Pseudomonas syringae pv. persicae]RMQ11526.1 Threonine transporter RhtB [Pseudomonas viridiflava]
MVMTMYYVAIAMLTLLLVPGPTNSLLLQSGVNRGLGMYSLKLIAAEWTAYLIQITAWGMSIDALANYGWVVIMTKILAVAFLFYISLKLWFSTHQDTDGKPAVISISALFLATLNNPKGLFFATFIAPAGTFLQFESYVSFMTVFSLVVLPVGIAWVGLGALCGRSLPTLMSSNRVNRLVSLVIGLFAIIALYNVASTALFT